MSVRPELSGTAPQQRAAGTTASLQRIQLVLQPRHAAVYLLLLRHAHAAAAAHVLAGLAAQIVGCPVVAAARSVIELRRQQRPALVSTRAREQKLALVVV